MRSVQPNADLPPSNSQTMLGYNSLPARPQRTTARNMTGIYLGSEPSQVSNHTRHSIPPLAKPRGVTVGTAAERRRQQQRVEALRIREEPRGFNPLPVKKPTKPKISRKSEQHINNSSGKHALDYSGITSNHRKTGRNFVPVANSGVKRLEDLRSETASITTISQGSVKNGHERDNIPHHPSPVLDKTNNNKNLIGLEDCYKKICKGNLSNLQNVMNKKQGVKTRTRLISTPLTIRSFRNPQNPHPVVQYTDPKLRPKTTIAATINRPPVPAPYYYNSNNLPRTADDGSSRVKLTREQDTHCSRHGSRVLAAPGVGVISGSTFRKRNSIPTDSIDTEGRPPSGISGSRPPCRRTNAKIYDSDEMYAQRDGFKVPSGTPVASRTDLTNADNGEYIETQSEGILKQSSQVAVPPPSPATIHRMKISSANKNNSGSDYDSEIDTRDGVESTISLPTIGTRPGTRATEHKLADSGIEEQDEGDDADGRMKVSIVISVEDEMGRHIDVDIEDEAGQIEVEKAATPEEKPVIDEVVSSGSVSEEIAGAAQEAATQKQSELQRLIEEHNELVLHIEELEKMKTTFSDDDLSSSDDESPAADTKPSS
ncbi:uncharacterized protein [Amphiura filiformis]|uniref:uncharacterized protein isoform X2 n=1 Tax=Amphiura filiformis TaxID=82378 RepID=UPI003B21C745